MGILSYTQSNNNKVVTFIYSLLSNCIINRFMQLSPLEMDLVVILIYLHY